jgi:hypothetical protein
MHTVVETPPYLRSIEGLFSEEERRAIVDLVSKDPECGELMPGTGGFRKVRFARAGMGKRGGARIIYIVRREDMPVFLISAYAKNTKQNLTKDERNKLAKRANDLFDEYRRVR